MTKRRTKGSRISDMLGMNGNNQLTKELFTWLFRVGALAAIFWVQGNFISREKYDKDRDISVGELHTIATNVQKITDKLETAVDLSSYETRIKHMEAKVSKLEEQKH